jgi:hypothetical protein
VVREEAECHDADVIKASGPGEDAEDDLVEQRPRGQEKPALDTPGGDFDQGAAFGDETQWPWHRGSTPGKGAANPGRAAQVFDPEKLVEVHDS